MAEEKDIENKIKAYLKDAGAYVVKHHGGLFSASGVPDLLCCYKGMFIAFEVKAKKGKATPLQKVHIHRIVDAGGRAYIVKSLREVEEIIETL